MRDLAIAERQLAHVDVVRLDWTDDSRNKQRRQNGGQNQITNFSRHFLLLPKSIARQLALKIILADWPAASSRAARVTPASSRP
jgi:hypothetical protein